MRMINKLSDTDFLPFPKHWFCQGIEIEELPAYLNLNSYYLITKAPLDASYQIV